MIDAKQIPDEVVEAAARAIYLAFTEVNIGDGEDRWERLPPRFRTEYREQARASIAAALNAWPGMHNVPSYLNEGRTLIVLPLPQEVSDE